MNVLQHYLESVKDRLWADGQNGVTPHPIVASGACFSQALLANRFPDDQFVVPVANGPVKVVEVEVTSTSTSSTEYKDESGVTRVHEIVVVEKTITTVDVNGSDLNDEALLNGEAVETTQGDQLNLRKVMRDKAHPERSQTRSMGKTETADPSPARPGKSKRKGKRTKKRKLQ